MTDEFLCISKSGKLLVCPRQFMDVELINERLLFFSGDIEISSENDQFIGHFQSFIFFVPRS